MGERHPRRAQGGRRGRRRPAHQHHRLPPREGHRHREEPRRRPTHVRAAPRRSDRQVRLETGGASLATRQVEPERRRRLRAHRADLRQGRRQEAVHRVPGAVRGGHGVFPRVRGADAAGRVPPGRTRRRGRGVDLRLARLWQEEKGDQGEHEQGDQGEHEQGYETEEERD